jgi:hypothetical protein
MLQHLKVGWMKAFRIIKEHFGSSTRRSEKTTTELATYTSEWRIIMPALAG